MVYHTNKKTPSQAEQEERKRLEALVRSLKMEQTIGKPTLNQSMVT